MLCWTRGIYERASVYIYDAPSTAAPIKANYRLLSLSKSPSTSSTPLLISP